MACAGRDRFVREGHAAQAAACGWSEQELFALPSNWHRVDETGAVWMITNWLVVDVTAEAIVIKPPWSESRLRLYRRHTLRSG